MYPGLPSRLEREIKQLYLERVLKGDTDRLSKFKIRIEDPPRRKDMGCVRQSSLADLKSDLGRISSHLTGFVAELDKFQICHNFIQIQTHPT